MTIALAGGDNAESVEWSDLPGIEVCQVIVDECAEFCAEAAAAGERFCSNDLYDSCSAHELNVSDLVERVPGLHSQLTFDVVMGWQQNCTSALGFLAAWRYE